VTWGNRRRERGRVRPWWRTATDVVIFLLVLAVVLKALERFDMIDLGSGNAKAKDGDSLVLNGTDVRLHGIDAPEYNQSCSSPAGEYGCGREALDALRDLLRGRIISCTAIEIDRYGRAVSICRDGTLEINAEMVRLGWAVAYLRHSAAYLRSENQAKAARRGIWQGKFELPENYRQRHRHISSGFDDN
jgi:endonuclease YncB( thermonuclease family)